MEILKGHYSISRRHIQINEGGNLRLPEVFIRWAGRRAIAVRAPFSREFFIWEGRKRAVSA